MRLLLVAFGGFWVGYALVLAVHAPVVSLVVAR